MICVSCSGGGEGGGSSSQPEPPSLAIFSTVAVRDIAVDGTGTVYALDALRKVHRINPAGADTTFASFGDSALTFLGGIAADDAGNAFVTRWDQCPPPATLCVQRAEIDRVDPSGNISPLPITTSSDGSGTDLGLLGAITRSPMGDLYFDTNVPVFPSAGAIRRLTSAGDITRVDNNPAGAMTVDSSGTLYFVRSRTVSKFMGPGMFAFVGGPFSAPAGVAVDAAGDVYVSDVTEHVVRKIAPSGTVTVIAGTSNVPGFAAGPLPGLLDSPTRLAIHGPDLYIVARGAIVVVHNVP